MLTLSPVLQFTFIEQMDGVSCHPPCPLTLHCALSRRVVKDTSQVPHDRLWLLREMAQATLSYNRSKSAFTPGNGGRGVSQKSLAWGVAKLPPLLKIVRRGVVKVL